MPPRIDPKWRPSLALVLGCTLAAVLVLPVAGIVAVRYLFPLIGYQEAVIAVSLAVVAVAAFVGYVLWRILLRPITALAARADAIRTGEAAALDPLAHYGTREMRDLGQAMRQMGQVLQGREMVLRSYADHVTHELKSPLTAVQGAVELLADPDLPAAERARLLSNVDGAARRMTDLIEAQKAFAKAHDPVAGGMSEVAAALPDQSAVTVRLTGASRVGLPEPVLRVVLEHLVSNAAAHGATEVTIEAGEAGLTITDNGPGISDGNRARIFDPFFTTRRDAGGTGMGLAIVRRMLQAQGADIALEPGPGARFRIAL